MKRKLLAAILVAVLSATGVILPESWSTAIVDFFIPAANASTLSSAHSLNGCWCGPVVEALRPSCDHYRSYRFASTGNVVSANSLGG